MNRNNFMKNYFPHDSDARSDDKIIALRIKHKWEGYGLYWALIEKLRESKDYTLKADYNVLAFDLRSDAALIKSIINDFGLFAFTENGECFYSESLTMRMKPLDDKKAKLSNAGKRGNEKRWNNDVLTSPPNRHPIKKQSPPDDNSIATQSPPNRHPIASLSQEEIRREEKREEDNIIPPTPPSKGGGRKKKGEPKEINYKARLLFEGHFKETFSDSYYWTPKDAGAMSQLLQKITFSRKEKGMPTDDESVISALGTLLSSIKEGWIFENFSVTNINSKYNEIVAQAKRRISPKPSADIGVVLQNNSPDKYDSPQEKRWEERWNR